MSGEVVNLRQARKRAAKADGERAAEANRRLHGTSKAEKRSIDAEQSAAERRLDGARLDRGRSDNGSSPDGDTPENRGEKGEPVSVQCEPKPGSKADR